MGKYGHPEFVERLRSYEQNAESILSMEDINKLMNRYPDLNLENVFKKLICGMTKRKIKSYVIKLNEETDDNLEGLTPRDGLEISLLLIRNNYKTLGVVLDGYLLKMQEYALYEGEERIRFNYIKVDCEEHQRKEKNPKLTDDQREY